MRVFLPSLITIFGSAGSTPAELIGVFALSWFLAAFLAVPAVRVVRPSIVALAGAFAYYAPYDLGITNDYVPIVVAALLAVLALVGPRAEQAQTVRPVGPAVRALAGAVVAGLAVAAVPVWRPAPPVWEPPTDGLRIPAYNIRMGFGLAGTLTLDDQAETLIDLAPEVIVLSEVDRAWFLNGGHDHLRLLADRLGLRYVWAPAADEVWGDALLTNLPVTSVRNHVLVRGGPTGAQALEVGLRWRDRDITVIATHLQPPADWEPLDQVEQLADIVRAAPRPVVVAGDLNLEPGDPAWGVLMDTGLVDAFAADRPFVTTPPPDVGEIDHILVAGAFRFDDPANPDIPYSDHRPVTITLIPAER